MKQNSAKQYCRALRVAAAKAWGYSNGYRGGMGGWVYQQKPFKPVCLGWNKFFSMHEKQIMRNTSALFALGE